MSMFSRNNKTEPEAESEKPEIHRTSAVNGVQVDVQELSDAVDTINRYKTAFGHHMKFYLEGGRFKVEISIESAQK